MSRAQALLLAGHGSQRHPEAATPVHAHADRVRARGAFDEVRTAFWKEQPAIGSVVATLRCEVVYVVPVLTSEGYFADRIFPRELAHRGEPSPVDLHYADPVGTHESMTAVVSDRVESVIDGPPRDAGVVLVGHGTDRHESSDRATRSHATRLADRGRYGDVRALFLDEAPSVERFLEHVDGDEIVVVPFFVADGQHTTRDIPDAIGHPGVGQTAAIGGRRVHYVGAVGTEPGVADVIVERAIEAGATIGRDGDDETTPTGPAAGAAEAFLASVRRGGGHRRWGEVAIDRTARGFRLRHAADAAVDPDRLDPLGDLSALRRRVRRDDHDRYRPHAGERSLPTGWILDGLDGRRAVRAVETVYPGSVADWYLEATGDDTTTAFRETVGRQTGEYVTLGSLAPDTIGDLARAVCGNCVRRREWTIEADSASHGDRDVEGIPCREACPFFLSAATVLGGAGELAGPPEDREVPIGAFEEPGNRYRVRSAVALDRRRAVQAEAPGGWIE